MSEDDIHEAVTAILEARTSSKPTQVSYHASQLPRKPLEAIKAAPSQATSKFFSQTILSTTSELPNTVITQLKGGFKNYIPLSLCTHKACNLAAKSLDAFDAEIGMNDKGEIKLKQKSLNAAKDHHLTTDDFTEIRENFIRGMRKHLIIGDDTEAGGELALSCADMFATFFSIIAGRPDFTTDWRFYRGYIIETYTSWIGRPDNTYGLVFDEHMYTNFKLKNMFPMALEHVKQQSNNPFPTNSTAFNSQRNYNGFPNQRGRGRGFRGGVPSRPGQFQSTSHSQFRTNPPSGPLKCYLCAEPHLHRDHQGEAKRLVLNDQGKWIDKAHGDRIICIAFNVSRYGCRQGSGCFFLHSCSLCGDVSHGSWACNT